MPVSTTAPDIVVSPTDSHQWKRRGNWELATGDDENLTAVTNGKPSLRDMSKRHSARGGPNFQVNRGRRTAAANTQSARGGPNSQVTTNAGRIIRPDNQPGKTKARELPPIDDAVMRYNTMDGKQYRKDAHMARTAISPMFRREGFTLIELLIVIVVMAILAAILGLLIHRAHERGIDTKSHAFVRRVAMAAGAFKGQNNGRYPGQDDIGQLKGTTPQAGPYTGSQILAARLFGYPDTEINAAAPKATSKYLEYKLHLLIKQSGVRNSLADDSSTANALLYFPSRLNVTAPSDCYKWDDNSIYISKDAAAAKAEFNKNCIRDPKFSAGDVARNAGGILIIGTGVNDTYLEPSDNDDIKNWD